MQLVDAARVKGDGGSFHDTDHANFGHGTEFFENQSERKGRELASEAAVSPWDTLEAVQTLDRSCVQHLKLMIDRDSDADSDVEFSFELSLVSSA